jgi:hypothetical protein
MHRRRTRSTRTAHPHCKSTSPEGCPSTLRVDGCRATARRNPQKAGGPPIRRPALSGLWPSPWCIIIWGVISPVCRHFDLRDELLGQQNRTGCCHLSYGQQGRRMARFRHSRPDSPPSGATKGANRGVGAVQTTRRARKLPGTNGKRNRPSDELR